jgi:Na+/H+ antiporter NhaD/arsenite permease-like protein
MILPAILSTAIFVTSLVLIFSEKLNRTIAALAGAILMVVVGLIFGFYTQEQAVATLDFNTLGLLLGMMILVAMLEPTGFFQFLAVWVARLSKGEPLRLLILLGTVTTLISMVLNNVTTVVLIAPVTILICEIVGISPQAFLMAEALLSNTGGLATLVGDPPNILIASAANFSFVDFLTHVLPIVVIVWFAALGSIRLLFRKELSFKSKNGEALRLMDPNEVLSDRKSATKSLIVIALTVGFFLFEENFHLQPALVALGGASIGLVLVQPDIQETLKRIEWDVLVFFAALFVMVGGMEQAGVLHALSNLILHAQELPPIVLGLIMMWFIAIASAIIDNVPITIALIPVVLELGAGGINPLPLWWALAIGAGLGGNGTIIGSTANVVVASLSERTRHPITSKVWNKRGLPVMLVTCCVASVLYVLFYTILSR